MADIKITDQEMGELTTKDLLTMESKLFLGGSHLMKPIQLQLTEIKITVGETQKAAEMAVQIGLTVQAENMKSLKIT